MPLILRSVLGTKLSITQMDGNLTYLVGTLSGSVIQVTGSSLSAPLTAITASIVSASFTGSLFGTASWALNAQQSTNTSADLQQITDNGNTTNNDIDTEGTLGLYSFPDGDYTRIAGIEGGLQVSNYRGTSFKILDNGSFILYEPNTNSSSLFTRPVGPNVSITLPAVSGQLLLTNQTASWAVSASQAVSASWAPSVASNPFPFTGSAIISGSLGVTGSLIVTGGITGSLQGTASYATQALSASYAPGSSPYSVYTALLSLSGGTFTINQLQNTIGDGSNTSPNDIQWSNPSNGVLRGTKSGSFDENTKLAIFAPSIRPSGVSYFVAGGLSSFFDDGIQYAPTLTITRHDNDQSSTPNFTDLPIEIRIYN